MPYQKLAPVVKTLKFPPCCIIISAIGRSNFWKIIIAFMQLRFPNIYHTPPRTSRISGIKSQVLRNQHFWVENDGEKWSKTFYFEILLAPLELPANLPGQLSLSGQIFFHWAAAILKGLIEFLNACDYDVKYFVKRKVH